MNGPQFVINLANTILFVIIPEIIQIVLLYLIYKEVKK